MSQATLDRPEAEQQITQRESENARNGARDALSHLRRDFPFFAGIANRWTLIETNDDACPYAGTNGRELLYNPKGINGLAIEDLDWLMLHEAAHIAFAHHLRMEDDEGKVRDPKLWNIACDAAINSYMPPPKGFKLETNCVTPARLSSGLRAISGRPLHVAEKQSAEYYYDLIVREMKKAGLKPGTAEYGMFERGAGDGEIGGVMEDPRLAEARELEAQGKPGEAAAERLEAKLDHHDALRQGQDEAEAQGAPDGSPGSISGSGGKSEAKSTPKQQEWQREHAHKGGRGQGDGAGMIVSICEAAGMGAVKLDWKSILGRFLSHHAAVRSSYERPSRRLAYLRQCSSVPIVMPGRLSRDKGRGCVLMDTSGSMSDAACNAGLKEVEKMVSLMEVTVDLIQADTRLVEESIKSFTRHDFPLRVPAQWMGRGGTDLCPAIEEIGKRARRLGYDWLVIVTDMEWDVNEAHDPGLPTVWLSTVRALGQLRERETPAFGTVLGPLNVD